MIKRIEVKTNTRVQLIDITSQVRALLKAEDISSGMVVIYSPHTTCGITINENADPDVRDDITDALEKLVPADAGYRHMEGNADAHIKTSLFGSSATVFVESSTMVLGTWQGIYLAEFDGPRQRTVLVKLLSDQG